ncbi:TolC family protein [uncultured Porphyromonas sp.]|uniref:TolC family protein n=1 Tax=uncultured Porphyromonas sp. TaxID=159274 RepID=UPI00260E674C|nr:TolC family protein [uncultured Porphyromonas sp.]
MEKKNRIDSTLCALLLLALLLLPAPAVGQAPASATGSSAGSAQPLKLSIDDAVRLALEQSAQVKTSGLAVDQARYEQKKTIGGLYPNVNLSGSYTYMLKKQRVYFGGDDPSSPMAGMFPADGIEMGEKHALQGGIVAGMPIIAPQLWASLELDKQAVALAEEKARSSKIALEAEVRKAYMGILLARESERVLQSNYDNAKTNYDQIVAKWQQGVVAEYDKIRMDAQVKNILPNLVQAREAIRLSEAKLKVLLALEPTIPIEITEQLSDYQQRVASALPERIGSVSLAENSQLRTLDLQGKQLDAALRVKKMAFMPTLSLSFNYMYNFSADKLKLDNSKRWSPFSTIALSLSVPLFNGFSRQNDVHATRTQLQQLQLQRVDAERQLHLSAMNSLSAQTNAIEQFVAAREAVASAEKGYQIAQVRYKTGEGTILELNDADMALLQARLNYSQAIYNYMVALYTLDELQGISHGSK